MRLGMARLRIAKDGDWPVLAAIGREGVDGRWDPGGYGWKTIAADEGLSLSSAAWFRSTSGAAAPGAWGLVPIGVIEDAAGLGEAFPRFAMALRTEARRGHDAFRLEAAGPALDLEDGYAMQARGEGIVRQKLSLRSEAFHAD